MNRFGLLVKLAGFYLLISLPTLILVEITVLAMEFREFAASADSGEMQAAVEAEALRLESLIQSAGAMDKKWIARELDGWILALERPRSDGGLQTWILLELSDQPFAAQLQAIDGSLPIVNSSASRWQIDQSDTQCTVVRELERQSTQDWRRRYQAPIRDAQGEIVACLGLEIRLPMPWRKLLFKVSYEWPLLITYLLVFSMGTVLFFRRWVTARLARIAHAADAWREGAFSVMIDDAADDELGSLSRRLDRMAGDLRDLVHARAQVATLNERARLARDLHDTVKQKAFALTLQIAAVRAAVAREGLGATPALEESRKLAEEIQRELALILDELRDDEQQEPLETQLRARIQSWSRRSGIAATIDLEAASQVSPLHAETLARLLDEALANIQRHSGAQRVAISLIRESEAFRLTIADNGRGMPPHPGAGMGLNNMRVRASMLPGGQLQMDNSGGLRIMLVWRSGKD